jgi:hypothetical protein
MKEEAMKTRTMMYESPRIAVRRIVLEGVIADSYEPVLPTGAVEYTDYDVVSGTQDGDVLLF